MIPQFNSFSETVMERIEYTEQICLPVAPRANTRIRFEPLNNKRQEAMSPEKAVQFLETTFQKGSITDTVFLYGPGDPLATPELTCQVSAAIKKLFPEINIHIKTRGINGEKYADQITKSGVTHIELEIDALDKLVLEKLFAWIRPGYKTIPLPNAVEILMEEQDKAIRAFQDAGVEITAVTTLYPENNVEHAEKLARILSKKGIRDMILIPHITSDHPEMLLPSLSKDVFCQTSKLIAKHMNVIEWKESVEQRKYSDSSFIEPSKPTKERPNVGVVSSSGMDIDLHLGQASRILIYGPREDGLVCLLETRKAPEPGGGDKRWQQLAATLHDCCALLAKSAGEKPKLIMQQNNCPINITEAEIEAAIEDVYGLRKKKSARNQKPT